MKYEAIVLPYAYDALEPHIDKETVEVHYEKHHKGYANKLNTALEGTNIPTLFPNIVDLMKKYQDVTEDLKIKTSIREFGGGLANHDFFWQSLKIGTALNDGALKKEIVETWGSIDKFKDEFKSESLKLFGSGWVWLVRRPGGGLKIIRVFNQDTPWFLKFDPLLGIDVWEHAYYLKHKSDRGSYVDNFWNVVNWEFVEEQYNQAIKKEA